MRKSWQLIALLSFLFVLQPNFAQEPATIENSTSASATAQAAESKEQKSTGIIKSINGILEGILFKDALFGTQKADVYDRHGKLVIDKETGKPEQKTVSLPFIVGLLLLGGIFFTFWYRFINIRMFMHSIDIIRGKYDNPEDKGEISHFKALTSALSATVGLGNIAGVAVAIQLGGPGAVFWMLLAAIFGMAAKFSSCTLSQLYRKVNEDGSISGGPMYYLDLGLRSINPGLGVLGKFLAILFAILVMGGALGGGNMFQINQTVNAFSNTFELSPNSTFTKERFNQILSDNPSSANALRNFAKEEGDSYTLNYYAVNKQNKKELADLPDSFFTELKENKDKSSDWGIGIIMMVLVGVVILGGIKRIGTATSRIVPTMCGLYVAASIYIILSNAGGIPTAIKMIFTMAFTDNAVFGGSIGVLVLGLTRAAFSNEAGLGSAAIAHAAAKTDEPVREGIVAMIGPFIDTVIICLMTALVVILTGTYNDPEIPLKAGAAMTLKAFGSEISWFPYVLTACIGLFAYSTMISWCYYGERGWIYLLDHFDGLGLKSVIIFRIFFIAAILLGALTSFGDVLTFSDLMLLSMAFPNIIGSIILAPIVWKKVKDYWDRFNSGEIKPVN